MELLTISDPDERSFYEIEATANQWGAPELQRPIGIARCGRKIPRWSPGQLRKTRVTNARQQGDLETAQQVLGHSSKQTTERHYAEVGLSRAEANAHQFG